MTEGLDKRTLAAAVLLTALALPITAAAQVFSWIDDDGATHYGDRPPDGVPARVIDPRELPVTTVGGSGLRDAEQAYLDRADERRAAAAAAAAAARPPSVNVTVNTPASIVERSRVYVYRAPSRRHTHPSWGWQIDYHRNGLSFSLGGAGDGAGPRRYRPSPGAPIPPGAAPPASGVGAPGATPIGAAPRRLQR